MSVEPAPTTRTAAAAAHGDARCFALLPCAGTGSRAGTAQPKQYQPVAGAPMVRHTLAALGPVHRIASVLVVVAPGDATLHSDAEARTVVAPIQLPVGVLTALFGVPVFLFLLTRHPR